jgi:hypothetical protein
MAIPSDIGDGDFNFSYGGGGDGGGYSPQTTANLTGSDAGAYDDEQQKNGWYDPAKLQAAIAAQGGNSALAGSYLNSILNPIANPNYWRDPGQDRSAGEQSVMTAYNPEYGGKAGGDNSYFSSSNGTILPTWLDGNGNRFFNDVYDNPTGSEHDKARVTYQFGDNGMATPVSAEKFYQPGDWVDSYRDLAKTIGVVGSAGLAGYASTLYGAAGGGAGSAAGAAEGGAGVGASGGGLSSADLAALHSAEGYGASTYAPAMNSVLADSAAGSAGYGASSAGAGGGAGTGFSWTGLGTQALKGGGINAGATAIQGGNGKQIWDSFLKGAAGGAIGYGVNEYNPAGAAGVEDADYQKIANRGISSGATAGVTGGNVGQAALMGSGSAAGNYAGGQVWNGAKDYFNTPTTGGDGGGGGDMPDYGYSSAPAGSSPVANWFSNNAQQSQAPIGYTSSPEVNQSLGRDTSSSLYNPDFDIPTGTAPQQQGQNPFKAMIASGLGFVSPQGANGASTPRFGDMAGSLAGLYSAWQQKKRLSDLRGGLSSMFGPNSPYAQQMQQQLDRRDAAAGRRSQYGPRQVELQARLAELNSRNAPQIQSLIGGETAARNAMLNNTLRLGQQSGGLQAGYNALQGYAQPYLNQWFGSPMAQPNVGPQLEDAGLF